MGELNDLEVVTDKTKELLGDRWADELAFGVAIFHYWIKIYYQSDNAGYNKLRLMFEKYYDC